jgi:hypothetical protein
MLAQPPIKEAAVANSNGNAAGRHAMPQCVEESIVRILLLEPRVVPRLNFEDHDLLRSRRRHDVRAAPSGVGLRTAS